MMIWLLWSMFWLAPVGLAGPAPVGELDAERFRVHVLTIGPGAELFTRFGHIAVLVEDRALGTARVYNYGTFSFDDPRLAFNYARGYLTYWLSVASFRTSLVFYRYTDRTVLQHTLNLPADRTAELVRRLRENARPENREYLYRHYLDNCCTRIRDLLDDMTEGAIRAGRDSAPTGRTFRDWTRHCLSGMPLSGPAIDYALGPAVDRPVTRWEEYFLPEPFGADMKTFTYGPNHTPLVARESHLHQRQGAPVEDLFLWFEWLPVGVWIALLALGLLLPLLLARKRPKLAVRLNGLGLSVWGLTAGLGGLILFLFWVATEHLDCHRNENLLLTPFTHLWLLGPGLKALFTGTRSERTRRWLIGYLWLSLGLIALDLLAKMGLFHQDNWRFIAGAGAIDALALAGVVRCRCLSLQEKDPPKG
jgi:hypothetical protein